ncbi:thioesterase II family protein [Rhodospirillum sp. A1_3_36]|uniref:thioesterase II family protein n=1 Tax=Rhodospirillum sp. A1_3_36 TaxID=3391666 RepID=UPI0039A69DA4
MSQAVHEIAPSLAHPRPIRLEPKAQGWLVRIGTPSRQAKRSLFCFTHAGGGAVDFRDWRPLLPDDMDLFALQLPGRGSRLQEPPAEKMSEVINQVLALLPPYLDKPFAFFGHSLGGRIAFALAQQLQLRGLPTAQLLTVAASRPPGFNAVNVIGMSDESLLSHLIELGGMTAEILDNDELIKLSLPSIRADFILHNSLNVPSHPLVCPVLSIGGRSDSSIGRQHVQRWQDTTQSTFSLEMVDGDHFFPRKDRAQVIQMILDRFSETVN